MITLAYWGCPLRDAPFLWCEVHRQSLRPCRSAAERAYNVPHKDHPLGVYADLKLVLQCRYGAGHATFPPSKERRPGLLLAPIHPSAWKGSSRHYVPGFDSGTPRGVRGKVPMQGRRGGMT